MAAYLKIQTTLKTINLTRNATKQSREDYKKHVAHDGSALIPN